MSSFVLNSFPLIVPRRGPEIQICLSGWISWARTNPTPPPMCFYDEPDQSYKVTLLPFILDCLVVLQFIFYPINLRPSTVFLFFLLHHCMASCLNISSFVSLLRPIYGPLRYLAKSRKVECDHQSMTPPHQNMTLYGT